MQSYNMAVQDMDIPYPSQYTMPSNNRPTSEMPFKCSRCYVHFLTNVLQNLRKRISAKLLEGGTRHGHTLSQSVHNAEQQAAHQRNAIQMF